MILLILAAVADILTTRLGLRTGAREGNGLAAKLMARFGRERAMIVGKVVTLGLVLLIARIWPLPGWFMTAAAVLWFGVAANNALIWIKRRAAKR